MAVLKELGLWPRWRSRGRPMTGPDWEALTVDLAALAVLPAAGGVAVPGAGNRNARLLVLAAAPGRPEALLDGPSGRLLDNMLKAIGLSRADVWLTCIARWPAADATAWATAAAVGDGIWRREAAWIAPAAVLALGDAAAAWLAGSGDPALPVVAIPAPDVLLQMPAAKAQAWQGLKQVAALLAAQPPLA